MKKSNATIIMVALIVLTGLAWVTTVKNQIKNNNQYNDLMQQAVAYEDKEIYVDAITEYNKILEMNPKDYDVSYKVAELYQRMKKSEDFIASCEKTIAIDKTRPEMYIYEIQYYMDQMKYTDAISVAKTANESVKDNEQLQKLLKELSYKYSEKSSSFEYIGDWHIQDKVDYVTIQLKGKYGITGHSGSIKMKTVYDYLGAYDQDTGVIPCSYNNQFYYIDINGNKKLVADVIYDYLGSFGNGYAPAKRNGKFGFINTKFEEKNFEYDNAGCFANGVAPVQKDGKWGLVGSDMKMVTGFDYDEILMDSYGYCSRYDVIVAKQNGKYVFIDKSGKKLSDKQFDGAKMQTSSDGNIAVKNGNKWGFANTKGEIVIQEQYEDADSFSLDLAPIKKGSFWGYINKEQELVIDDIFNEARPFSANGSAQVKGNANWNFIVLCEYDS